VEHPGGGSLAGSSGNLRNEQGGEMSLSMKALLRAAEVAEQWPAGHAEYWGQSKRGNWIKSILEVVPGKG